MTFVYGLITAILGSAGAVSVADLPGRTVRSPLLAGLIIFDGNLTIAFLTGGPK